MAELNKNQLKAVEATEGKVRVVAGAGSGKTRVLAHRFAFLVNELGISPGNILCLTFTNKAAQEMKRRIARMVDRGSINDFVCTIHSFCVKFLRREIYRIGYPKTFLVIDEEDCRQLARQAMQEFGIDRKKTTAERFLKQVAGFKGMAPDDYILRHIMPGSSSDCPDAIVRYIRLQLKQYALDYDDLLYFTLFILNHFPDAREYWTDRLNYIMVDEVQDCSGDDWKLLNILKERHGNLFVVGDPDQAIYEWRGACPRIFVDFKANTDVILDENYRSTPDILNVANPIIANNANRVKKELYTRALNERQAVYHHAKSERDEADMIADRIEKGIKEGAAANSFAVLYRTSFASRLIEQALLRRQIPYTVWGGVRFFERREIKDVISYLRLIASDADDMAFMRIVNVPSRKFGSKSLESLTALAETNGTPLFTTLREAAGEDGSGVKPALRAFITLIEEARRRAPIMKISELTDWMLKESGLESLYRNDEEEERLENLSELINSMKEFEATRFEEGEADLTSYLQEISLYVNSDLEDVKEKVKLMTIHQSKGLEFDTVFVAGLTEGIFPSHRTIRERRKDGEEEERRLMYVAVTRAMRMLYLSESEGYLNDTGALKYPSRFISEVPDGILAVEGNPDPSLFEGTRSMVNMVNGELGDMAEEVMTAGTAVSHRVFGQGIVESYDPASKSYRVRFGENVRNLIARVLTKL
ncbi:MAG: UvrD-helicase domain-containing protein [Bacteroidales bacterium]|nr:UvrD-helicase domain-containing protein [Bacteroidales bacterium]